MIRVNFRRAFQLENGHPQRVFGWTPSVPYAKIRVSWTAMHKIAEVEAAKQLMTEAKDWSVWQWLTEKRRVRVAADAATAALERTEKKVKAEWPDHVRKLYPAAVREVKKADDAAYEARIAAEATFDEAERRMSASMAREGAQQAIDAYSLHEHAIRKAEAVARNKVSGY